MPTTPRARGEDPMCVECTASADAQAAHTDLLCDCVCSPDMTARVEGGGRRHCRQCDHNLP